MRTHYYMYPDTLVAVAAVVAVGAVCMTVSAERPLSY
jgi:hypothetical protein